MSTIVPEEKKIQDALKWISEGRERRDIKELIQEASLKFNLSPKEEKYLYHLFKEELNQRS